MVFVLHLWTVRDGETNLAKAADDFLGDLRQRMQFPQQPAPAWEREIGRFFGQRTLEFKLAAALRKSRFQLGFRGINGFSGGRFFFFRKRGKLLEQSREFAVRTEIIYSTLFQCCEIWRVAQFGQPGLFQRFNLLEESAHKS